LSSFVEYTRLHLPDTSPNGVDASTPDSKATVRSKMVRFVWVASAPGLRLAATAWSSSFFIAATSEDESDAVATMRVWPRHRRRNLAGEGTRTDVDSSDVDMTKKWVPRDVKYGIIKCCTCKHRHTVTSITVSSQSSS
jgi:hypothetical protein